MRDIVFITGNENKIKEARELLGINVGHEKIDLDEIQSLDPKVVISHKLDQAYDLLKKPVFVEDVSLELSALNGFPGPLIKFFLNSLGRQKICDIVHSLHDTKVVAKATIGYKDDKSVRFFEGSVLGDIAKSPLGDSGFGWDPIFIRKGESKSFAQMSLEDKNKNSHRSVAFEKFKNWLDSE